MTVLWLTRLVDHVGPVPPDFAPEACVLDVAFCDKNGLGRKQIGAALPRQLVEAGGTQFRLQRAAKRAFIEAQT